jgi:hypothetical protein
MSDGSFHDDERQAQALADVEASGSGIRSFMFMRS